MNSRTYRLSRELYEENDEGYYEVFYDLDINYIIHAHTKELEIMGITLISTSQPFLVTDEELKDIEREMYRQEFY